MTIAMPSLNERREDIPLLMRHLLLSNASTRHFVDPQGAISSDGRLLRQLLRRVYSRHVSELRAILGALGSTADGDQIPALAVGPPPRQV